RRRPGSAGGRRRVACPGRGAPAARLQARGRAALAAAPGRGQLRGLRPGGWPAVPRAYVPSHRHRSAVAHDLRGAARGNGARGRDAELRGARAGARARAAAGAAPGGAAIHGAGHRTAGPLRLACRHAARVASAIGLPAPVEGKGLVTGGRVLALVGGDGAGKTTCATELTAWLGHELATLRVHLGRPPRSLASLAVGCALKVARWLHGGLAAHFELLRCVCTARDR